MNIDQPKSLRETSESNISESLQRAQVEALALDELEAIKDRIDELTRDFIQQRINLAAYREVEGLENYPGAIDFDSETDFEAALRSWGLNEDVVQEVVKHETEHFQGAAKLGLIPKYRIEISKRANGYSMYPAIRFDLPEDTSEERARDLLRQIIGAASELSERDVLQLGSE